ncbi:MAG: DUF4266 domain-containing protein [Bacteroidota bacterium]
MKKIVRACLLLFVLATSLSSCVSVASYQKMYLNDEDMQLEDAKIQAYEINVASYREGAAGINGGKVGGGCGCN